MSGQRDATMLRTPVAALIIVVAGIATFFVSLGNGFHGDDFPQIVNNPPVHSIANIGLFFRGGTFYNGPGPVPLVGTYYRPLMTTMFALIYTLFGANPIPFHVVQEGLIIASAVLLLLVFLRCSFAPALALALALVFLVHPVDSQVAYDIPFMQDALFFFFGVLGFWILLRFRSPRALAAVALCLLLSLLSKETGILFVLMALIYVVWWNRSRLVPFMTFTGVALVVWAVLRGTSTVGWLVANAHTGPIDDLGLGGRMMTAPSVMLLYLTKLVWPVHLASFYYFVHPTFSIADVGVPFLIDVAVVALVIYVGMAVRRAASTPALPRTYWFFAIWAGIGIAAHLQIAAPLDATANEVWFHFPMAGVLGMAGVAITTLGPHARVPRTAVAAVAAALIVFLAVLTGMRATVWADAFQLAQQDVANSPDDWAGYSDLASQHIARGDCDAAIEPALTSVRLFPTIYNYTILGNAYMGLGRYAEAADAYMRGLNVAYYIELAHGMAQLTTVWGDPAQDKAFLEQAVSVFPQDGSLWTFLAYFDYRHGDVAGAQQAITQAYTYDSGNATVAYLYSAIMGRQQLAVTLTPPKCTGG